MKDRSSLGHSSATASFPGQDRFLMSLALFTAVLGPLFPVRLAAQGHDTDYALSLPQDVETTIDGPAAVRLNEMAWRDFGRQLRSALGSGDSSAQILALQLLIQNKGRLHAEDALSDLLRICRESPSPRVKRMAVAALGTVGGDLVISFLRQQVYSEKAPSVRHAMLAAVAQHTLQSPGSWRRSSG